MRNISIRRPPTLDTTITHLGRFYDHKNGRKLLTPEEAHKTAAYLFAANYAYKQNCIHPSFRDRRMMHTPCAAGAAFEELITLPVYLGMNNPPQVEVDFSDYKQKKVM